MRFLKTLLSTWVLLNEWELQTMHSANTGEIMAKIVINKTQLTCGNISGG